MIQSESRCVGDWVVLRYSGLEWQETDRAIKHWYHQRKFLLKKSNLERLQTRRTSKRLSFRQGTSSYFQSPPLIDLISSLLQLEWSSVQLKLCQECRLRPNGECALKGRTIYRAFLLTSKHPFPLHPFSGIFEH